DVCVEFDFREDGRIWPEVNSRPGSARGPDLLQRADRFALLESHLPLRPIALDRGDELFRQLVHDACANSVESAGGFVIPVFELSTGVEHGEDHLEGAFLAGGVLIDLNSATVVFDRD